MSEHSLRIHDHLMEAAIDAGVAKRRGRIATFFLGRSGPMWAGSGSVATRAQQEQAQQAARETMQRLHDESRARAEERAKNALLADGLNSNDPALFQQYLNADNARQTAFLEELEARSFPPIDNKIQVKYT